MVAICWRTSVCELKLRLGIRGRSHPHQSSYGERNKCFSTIKLMDYTKWLKICLLMVANIYCLPGSSTIGSWDNKNENPKQSPLQLLQGIHIHYNIESMVVLQMMKCESKGQKWHGQKRNCIEIFFFLHMDHIIGRYYQILLSFREDQCMIFSYMMLYSQSWDKTISTIRTYTISFIWWLVAYWRKYMRDIHNQFDGLLLTEEKICDIYWFDVH